MIFSNQTSTCDFVSMFLNENNIECVNINGQMAVALKQGKFEMFKSGKVNVLSCTDIASRGLDTTRVSIVTIIRLFNNLLHKSVDTQGDEIGLMSLATSGKVVRLHETSPDITADIKQL